MTKKPKISCVVPARNAEKTIRRTIDSILKQSIDDWELIIVDDHSKSKRKLKNIISSYKDKRIRYFRLEDENGIGIPAARNFGNMMAKSSLIAVMDSDDESAPERFRETLGAFIKYDCDIVYADIDNYNLKDKKSLEREKNFIVAEFDLERFRKYDFIPHPTVAYKKEIALKFPYNSFFRIAEDHDFLLRLAVFGYKFHFIDKKLVKYNFMPGKYEGLNFDYPKLLDENQKNYY